MTPVFLGVTVGSRLPAIHQFLFHLAGRRTSYFEIALRSASDAVIDTLKNAGTQIVPLPAITFADHTLLSGPAFVVPTKAVPELDPSINRSSFFLLHDWLAANELPRLVQAWVNGRAPLWVDLDHPLGIRNLLNLVRNAKAFLLRPPLTRDADFETEYYVELAAGERQRRSASPGSTGAPGEKI